MADELKIDTVEEFPHLANAPIVEAALEIRARAEAQWDERLILEQLKSRLPEYPVTLAQHAFQHQFQFGPNQPIKGNSQDLGLKGFRLQSKDNLQIVQFNRDGFVFSKLQPYKSWQQFSDEAFRLILSKEKNLDYYLVAPPATPPGLSFPFAGFLHHDSFAIPSRPYLVNVVKTIQPQQNGGQPEPALIFDIDVFSEQPFELTDEVMRERIVEMRWLKNKFFFGNITSQALETLK